MKLPISNYTFNAAAKTITFTDYTSIRLEGVLIITNVTQNTIIYLFNDVTKGGTVVGNVLTLTFNTTAYNNTDKLNIVYEDFRLYSLPSISAAPNTTITRTANTTPYAIDDVWGGRFSLPLPITGSGNNSIILTKVNLKTSLAALPSNFGSFRLFLFYNTTDSGNIADNDPFTIRQEAIDYDGYLLNPILKAASDTGGRSTTYDINVCINLPNTINTLYGYLVNNIAYTPLANADTINIRTHLLVA